MASRAGAAAGSNWSSHCSAFSISLLAFVLGISSPQITGGRKPYLDVVVSINVSLTLAWTGVRRVLPLAREYQQAGQDRCETRAEPNIIGSARRGRVGRGQHRYGSTAVGGSGRCRHPRPPRKHDLDRRRVQSLAWLFP